MAPLNCCSFRRAVSPEPQPAVLINTSRTGERFALSSHTPSRAGSHEKISTTQPVRKISALANNNDVAHDTSPASGNDIASAHETVSGVRHRGSNSLLHGVASKVRKRISRDSGVSKRSSKTRPRSSLSEDEYQRREELKRALHQRVREHIQEGSNISDASYDEDAVPIGTPRGTWGRHEGSIQISPKHLSNALRRSESPSAYAELDPRILSQAYAPKNTAMALSRMLVQRGSNLARESEEQVVESKAENIRRASTTQKYEFSDEDSPMQVPKTRSHSPLGRSNTVLHMPISTKALQINVANPEFLNSPGASSYLLPIRPKRLSDSTTGGDSRLSFADLRQGTLSNEANETHRSTLGSARVPGIYDTKIRPASEQLRLGTSGLWGHPVNSKHSNIHSTSNSHTSSSNGRFCNPGNEEMSFGGTDGKDYSPPTSEKQVGPPTRERGRSEGGDPVHLYNMHIPQRLASRPLLPSVSLPQLQHSKRDRSYTSGSSSRFCYVKPRSQPSSSLSTSGKQLKTPATHFTSSSVYSSGSLPPSPPYSTLQINSLSDRLNYLEVFQPSEEIISVPATRPRSVDLDNLERCTVETSYHSSNESLMNRKLAAAETRISPLPRANTLPKYSRFREDLDRISAELALTNPPRRRVSNLDGAGSPADEDTTSVWEKALREHSQEDNAISHTRIGSTAPDVAGPRLLDPQTAASNGQKARKRSSFLRTYDRRVPAPLEGASLQAHLGAYTLPPRRESTRRRPALEGIRTSPSAIRASSWARYPSHTRPERSTSPAGAADHVYSHDFAITPPNSAPTASSDHAYASSSRSNGKKAKAKSMGFGKQMLSAISGLYKSQSQELQRRLANEARGHRSSVSEGGRVEYPELEMLGTISPPMPSPDVATKRLLEERVGMAGDGQGGVGVGAGGFGAGGFSAGGVSAGGCSAGGVQLEQVEKAGDVQPLVVSRKQSQDWAREYQAVILPRSSLTVAHPDAGGERLVGKEVGELLAEKEAEDSRGWGAGWSEGVAHNEEGRDADEAVDEVPHRMASECIDPLDVREEGEAGLRGGTVDFGRSLELDEWVARERVGLLGRGGVGMGMGTGERE